MRSEVRLLLACCLVAACGAKNLDAIRGPDGGGKRGLAANAAPSSALAPSASAPGISWWYNWSTQSSGGDPSIEFVPMVWGGGAVNDALPTGASYVLGFNEPNFKSQANLTPQQAAAAWPTIEAHAKAAGIPLVSPAVNFCGSPSSSSGCSDPTVTDPYTWLKDFFAACNGCEVDYIAVHWYNCDLPSLKAYIEGNGGGLAGFVQFGKPIWLTEFSCDGSHPVADQKAYMQAAIPYLESNTNIFRYSWFSAGAIPSSVLANADGSLTELGATYVGLPQSCP
jgi:putative glycosyl hydrolase